MLAVEHLGKWFGSTKAVDDLTFSIDAGQIVGFLGPNGAGKTTTMRLIAGYLAPDEGWITINGEPVGIETADTRRLIGYLPENNPLWKDMLVGEVLDLSADLKGIPAAERRRAVEFAVTSVSIGDVYYRPVRELSKGYKQRVGMAVALLHRPPLLILDEPTEGLDPNQRADLRALIQELAKERTILLSTHVMQEASALCSRILIINKGKLVADGSPQDLARKTQRERRLTVEIEGTNVESALRALQGVLQVLVLDGSQGRTRLSLTSHPEVELRPEVMRLAQQNAWILWQLAEEEQKLEDVFHTLTNL